MTTDKPLLKISKLNKKFRSHWAFRPIRAVNDISFEVHEGESFGFLGHNGAGKTTTIKCIVGILKKNSGTISFADSPDITTEDRQNIGYLPEHPYFYDHLSVNETLFFLGSLYKIDKNTLKSRVEESLTLLNLEDRAKQPVKSLSKGLQQRVGFAQAIINKPRLLILDEPFSGLDPVGRQEIRKLILDLNSTGTTIMMSSHILSDVEDICNRVCMMVQGQIKSTFNLADKGSLFGSSYNLSINLPQEKMDELKMIESLSDDFEIEQRATENIGIYVFSDYTKALDAINLASNHHIEIKSFVQHSPSLEEIFMKNLKEHRK